MDIRKVALWMVGIGGGAVVVGLVADAIQHADDPALRSQEGIFALSSLSHATFFAGIVLAVLGVALLFLGPALYGEPASGATGGRRLAQILAPVCAVVLVAGCTAAAGNSWLADGTGTAEAGHDHGSGEMATEGHDHGSGETATEGHDHGSGEMATEGHEHGTGETAGAHGTVIPGTATGDSPCEIASPTPASPGQVGAGSAGSESAGEGHGEVRGMVVQEPLTEQERLTLQQQMAEARTVIDRFPTVADAEAAGYRKSTPYVPCIGAHYTNIGLIGGFDPAAPSELLYDGTDPDSRIVGLSYLVYNRDGAPEAFAGPNDHFHQHNANGGLCLKGGLVVAGESSTPEQCEAAGGRKTLLENIWMAHAWVVPGFECSWGVFAGECPELGGRMGGTAWES